MTKKDGLRIRKVLKIKGISIADLAKEWNRSRWHIYAILAGKDKGRELENRLKILGGLKKIDGLKIS